LSSFYIQKNAQSKREADKLKIYIAALVAYIDNNCSFGHPDIGEARANVLKIYHPSLHVDLVREAIAKIASGEFNP